MPIDGIQNYDRQIIMAGVNQVNKIRNLPSVSCTRWVYRCIMHILPTGWKAK